MRAAGRELRATLLLMIAERDELRELVERLPDGQVPAVLAEARRHLNPASERPWPRRSSVPAAPGVAMSQRVRKSCWARASAARRDPL